MEPELLKAIGTHEMGQFEEATFTLSEFVLQLGAVVFPPLSPFAYVVGKIGSSRSSQRVNKVLTEVYNALGRLQSQISESITLQQFLDEVELIVERVARETRQEKLNCYRNYIVNTAIQAPPEDLRDLLLWALDRLSPIHLRVFILVVKLRESFAKGKKAKDVISSAYLDDMGVRRVDTYIAKELGISTEVVQVLLLELESVGLIAKVTGMARMTLMPDQLCDSMNECITNMGAKFENLMLSFP